MTIRTSSEVISNAEDNYNFFGYHRYRSNVNKPDIQTSCIYAEKHHFSMFKRHASNIGI